MPYSNPISQAELQDLTLNNPLHPRDGSPVELYMPPAYFMAPPATQNGPVKWRLFDAAYISTGIIDPNRLGTGATGAGNLYLADNGQWKTISVGGGGDMLKSTYDTDNSGVVDNAEMIAVVGRNATGSTLYRGTIVYISGSTGNRPNFVKAQANVEATSAGTFGVVVNDIANNSDGYVAHIGVLNNLDTRSTATNPFTDVTLADGDTLYLHPTIAGYVTNVKPSAPNHLVYVGKVTRTSPTNGTIVYRIQNGYELDELHDVAISSKANNDLLVYESATNLWKNKTIAAIFGGTPLVSVPTLAQVTTAGNTTTNAITVGAITGNDGTVAQLKFSSGAATLTPTLAVANTGSGGKFAALVAGTSGSAFIFDTAGFFAIQGQAKSEYTSNNLGAGTATEYLRIAATGNVLINTTTDAGYKLDVNGTARVSGDFTVASSIIQKYTSGGITNDATKIVTNNLGASFGVQNSNASGFSGVEYLDQNGNVKVFTGFNNNNAKEFRFNNISTNGFIQFIVPTDASSYVDFGSGYSGGVVTNSLFRFRSNGNVTIGTTTDAGYKLDVNGTVRIKGTGTTSSTTAFTITNSAAAYNSLIIRDDGTFVFGNPNNGVAYLSAASNGNITATYFNAGLDVGAGRKVTSVQYFASGSVTASSALAQGIYFNNTLVAAANNDVLVGLDINPTYTKGAFTGVLGYGLRITSPNTTDTALRLVATEAIYAYSAATRVTFNIDGTYGQLWNVRGLLYIDQGANSDMIFRTNAGSERMRIFAAGNIGINTTTDAGYKLDVNGSLRTNSTVNFTGLSSSTTSQVIYYNSSTGLLTYGAAPSGGGGGTLDTVTTSGNTTTNSISVGGLTVANSSVPIATFNSSNGGGTYLGIQYGGALKAAWGISGNIIGGLSINDVGFWSSNAMAWEAGGAQRMFLTAGGNLLINTISDNGNRLQVNGIIDGQGFASSGVSGFTGTFTVPTNPVGQRNLNISGGIITGIS